MPPSDATPIRFLHPRHWPTWVVLGLLWCAARLPWGWQMACGRLLGRSALLLARRRRAIAATNLRLCFPELHGRRRAALLRKHFESFGMGVIEVAVSWWTPDSRLRALGQIEGLEHVHAALRRGKGVILLSAHFTSLEIGGRLLALHLPFHVVYRPNENPLVEAVMRRGRERRFDKAIARDDIRGMLQSLKQNHAVWYASDQNYGHKHSVFAPFFGIPAATNTATTRIARISGAAVVPFFVERRSDGTGYSLRLLPALNDFPSGDVGADTQRINRLIEDQVRKAPEQYFWMHRRFKDRPPGHSDLYAA